MQKLLVHGIFNIWSFYPKCFTYAVNVNGFSLSINDASGK